MVQLVICDTVGRDGVVGVCDTVCRDSVVGVCGGVLVGKACKDS